MAKLMAGWQEFWRKDGHVSVAGMTRYREAGPQLGVGGHLTALRRLAVGRFTSEDATPLAGGRFLTPPRLFSPREALTHLPAVQVPPEIAARVQKGQRSVLPALGEQFQAGHGPP